MHAKIKAKCSLNGRGLHTVEGKMGMSQQNIYRLLKIGELPEIKLKQLSALIGIDYEFLTDNTQTNLLP